jgi:hypothetical protein
LIDELSCDPYRYHLTKIKRKIGQEDNVQLK